MESVQSLDQLSQICKGKDWFYDIGSDEIGRVVVYVHFLNLEVLKAIPDMVGDTQILVHFVSSLTATKDKFVEHPLMSVQRLPEDNARLPSTEKAPSDVVQFGHPVSEGEDLDEIFNATDEQSVRHLQNELDRLEKQCGSFTLQDIFYEIQDGKNAVTNMSARYPDVRKGLEKLFEQYGFDVIYEELDG